MDSQVRARKRAALPRHAPATKLRLLSAARSRLVLATWAGAAGPGGTRAAAAGHARGLAVCFCIFSVAGHWMEMGYSMLIRLGLIPGEYSPASAIWADWLTPFYVYGLGAVACALLLAPLKRALQRRFPGAWALVLSFAANMIACTGIELANGLLCNRPLPDGTLPLWDYSDLFCNFQGQVCLQVSLAFGLVSTLMVWAVLPRLGALFARMPPALANAVALAVVLGFAALCFR